MKAKVISECYIKGEFKKAGAEIETDKKTFEKLEKANCLRAITEAEKAEAEKAEAERKTDPNIEGRKDKADKAATEKQTK